MATVCIALARPDFPGPDLHLCRAPRIGTQTASLVMRARLARTMELPVNERPAPGAAAPGSAQDESEGPCLILGAPPALSRDRTCVRVVSRLSVDLRGVCAPRTGQGATPLPRSG